MPKKKQKIDMDKIAKEAIMNIIKDLAQRKIGCEIDLKCMQDYKKQVRPITEIGLVDKEIKKTKDDIDILNQKLLIAIDRL